MSFSYGWTPVLPKPPGGFFTTELASLLTTRFSNGWGSDRMELNGIRIDAGHIDWLSGVRDATSDDEVMNEAQEMIEAIRKYGVIELSVER
jgi:hypothetical protein